MGKIKYGLPTLLAIGFWMDVASATVLELPAWERNYTGTIAGKSVNVNITRFGNTLYGGITAMNLAISTRQRLLYAAHSRIKRYILKNA